MNTCLRALVATLFLASAAPGVGHASPFMPHLSAATSFDGYTDLSAWAAATVPSGTTVHFVEALSISNGFSPVPAVVLGISNGFSPVILVLTEDACTGGVYTDACYSDYSVLIGSTLEGFSTSPMGGLYIEQHIHEPDSLGGLSETGYVALSLSLDSSGATASGSATLHAPAGDVLATRALLTNETMYFSGAADDVKYGLAGSLLSLTSLVTEHGDLSTAGSVLSPEYVLAEAFAGGQLSGWEMFGVSTAPVPYVHADADWDIEHLLSISKRMQEWVDAILHPWCFPIFDEETGEWIDPVSGESLSPWVVDETGY